MTNPAPPQPTYAPTPGLVTTTWDIPRQAPAPAAVFHHAPIPVLPVDHHHTVDWARFRRAVRVCVTPASVTGAALSPLWANWALPLAASKGLGAAVGLDVLTAVFTAIAVATGRLHRALAVVVLVAAGLGTLELIPPAVTYWILER